MIPGTAQTDVISLDWSNLVKDFSPEYVGFDELNFADNGDFFMDAYFHTKRLIKNKYDMCISADRVYYTTWWSKRQVRFQQLCAFQCYVA